MTDFVIRFSDHPEEDSIRRALRARPFLEESAVETRRFRWGFLVAQQPHGAGYAIMDRAPWTYVCAGRPRLLDVEHEARGPEGFLSEVADHLDRERGWADVFSKLTGMYAIARCSDAGVELLTDQMGFRPVYLATATSGRLAGLATYLEPLAELAGRADDWDPVALAELLVRGCITHPHTTRHGVEELPPASIVQLNPLSEQAPKIRSLWRPAEGGHGAVGELAERLEQALREAGGDMVRGCRRVGATLSGGWDSRAVLASLPRDCEVTAITFRTRENRETQTAAEVARALRIRHVFADRHAAFFADLPARSVRLLGVEVRANAHGLCIRDAGCDTGLDVVVGGQLSDTFMKDHFMRPEDKERFRRHFGREALAHALKRLLGRAPPPPKAGWEKDEDRASRAIRAEVWETVRTRQQSHMERVRAFRPRSAQEWWRSWPTSRQHDAGHNLGNSRLFASDSLYMHRSLVEVAVLLPDRVRCEGRLAHQVFRSLFGPALNQIPISNTGVAPSAGPREEARILRERRRSGRTAEFKLLPGSDSPWDDVQGSWVDSETLQKTSPSWHGQRSLACESPLLDVLQPVTREDPRALLRSYRAEYGPTLNWTLMQLALFGAPGALS